MRGVLIAAVATRSAIGSTTRAEDVLDAAWTLHDQVSLRPERFGALAYHFGTRRLSFIKDHGLLAVVRALGDHESARAACATAGIDVARVPAIGRALATLADSTMIVPAPTTSTSEPA